MRQGMEVGERDRAERRVEVAMRDLHQLVSDLAENVSQGDYGIAAWSARDVFNAAVRVRNACEKVAAL